MAVRLWVPGPLADDHRAALPPGTEVSVVPRPPLPDRLGSGDMLVASFDPDRDAAAVARIDSLRVVQTLSAGVDGLEGRIPSGVTLCDAAGVHDVSVAEWVVMVILAMRRRLAEYAALQAAGTWRRLDGSAGGEDLEGLRVLVLGHGSIGRAVEARLRPFGAVVTGVARHARDGVHGSGALDGLLPTADVVVVLLPLTAQTRGMVDARRLALMHDGALLVNAARGPVVDTAALTAEVVSGRLRAALDVVDPEPLPDGHPLWSAPGVLITPHVAGTVSGFRGRAWRLVGEQVRRLEAGLPLLNVVVDGY